MRVHQIVVLAVVGVIASMAADVANATNLVVNESFETTVLTLDWPNAYGVWGGNMANSVLAENGIAPVDGVRMLQFEASNWHGYGATGGSQLCQVLDLGAYTPLIQSGNAVAVGSAFFNRVAGDAETDSEFAIRLYAYDGTPDQHLQLKEALGHLLRVDTLLFSDGDSTTWEEAVVEMPLPVDTDFLVVELAANENVYNDHSPPEFDGHYADVAVVTIAPASPVVIPEPLTMLAVGLSVVGLGRYVRTRRTRR